MRRAETFLRILLAASVLVSGCMVVRPPCELDPEQDFFRTVAATPPPTTPPADSPPGEAPLATAKPLSIDETSPPPAWELSLADAVKTL